MPLIFLTLSGCSRVDDLTPLQGMKLKSIALTPANFHKGMDVIRPLHMPSLKLIGPYWPPNMTPAEFWSKYEAGAFK